ncbi:tetratricopeptide repeat protein [Geitlerinema sp. PCC 9228]|uniref:tetratricopeptide repeat protein n=1 Tax=Geitlerinema sp. PCC 9228 TaxID=111611 RepID=UPI0008F99119|nr:tetratricopeptide repeat protein [Geitlerinema sp. PCC 9228]
MAKLHPEEQKKVNRQKRLQKLRMVVMAFAFTFTFGSPFVRMFWQSFEEPTQAEVAQQEAKEKQQDIQEKIKGYQLVLEREPENRNALEGLAEAYIKMGKFEAAVKPLQKLVELYPQQEKYQQKLSLVKGKEKQAQ